MMKRTGIMLLLVSLLVSAPGSAFGADMSSGRPEDDPAVMMPENSYELVNAAEVSGRQGVCSEGDYYWVSGSAVLAKYDKEWNAVLTNDDPFKDFEIEVNHIGDIDVYLTVIKRTVDVEAAGMCDSYCSAVHLCVVAFYCDLVILEVDISLCSNGICRRCTFLP